MIDVPLASDHSNILFTLATTARQDFPCSLHVTCQTHSETGAPMRFVLQVERIAVALQDGARKRYPELAQRSPNPSASRFHIFVIAGDAVGSTSSANGRIALNAPLGASGPSDEWLAFVIAREMGHVIARHHEENSSASIVTSVIMNLLIPASGIVKSVLAAGGSRAAAVSKHNIQAKEADAIALELLKAAGYRLHDVSLALHAAPALPNDSQWSRSFSNSADRLIAQQRSDFENATAKLQPKIQQPPDMVKTAPSAKESGRMHK